MVNSTKFFADKSNYSNARWSLKGNFSPTFRSFKPSRNAFIQTIKKINLAKRSYLFRPALSRAFFLKEQ